MTNRLASRGLAVVVGSLLLVVVLCVLGAYLAAVALGGRGGDVTATLPTPLTPALVDQGAYLADVGDCASCHTAKGGARFAGGLAISSPIGVIYAPNITPDAKTGIGAYTFGQFARVLRRGVLPNGQSLYPAMPYPSFSRLTDQDVAALYAFFMHGVAPVSKTNHAEGIIWPLSMRWPLTYWRWLFGPAARPFAASKGETPTVARGAYLVEGLGHCGACHTPRAVTVQELALTSQDGTRYLAGSRFNGWYAPSLRQDALSRLGLWREADIIAFLASGRTTNFAAFGEMGEVVAHSTRLMSNADLTAVAAFLQTLPAAPGSPTLQRTAPPSHALRAGEAVFADNCAACHQADGLGVAGGFPALVRNPVVNAADPTSLIHLVLTGGAIPKTSNTNTPLVMPPFASTLSDQDIADVLTYSRSAWGNRAAPVSSAAVKRLRASLGAPEPPTPKSQ